MQAKNYVPGCSQKHYLKLQNKPKKRKKKLDTNQIAPNRGWLNKMDY